MSTADQWTRERLRNDLHQLSNRYKLHRYSWNQLRPPLSCYQRAAVLIPLFLKDGEIHVWLTKRSQHVGLDKGHVAFPGGMADDTDTDESATCLREAEEEVGLRSHQVELAGRAVPRLTSRDMLIQPIVGIVHADFVPIPNVEVEFAFDLPLKRFIKDVEHISVDVNYRGTEQYVSFFTDDINGEPLTTWGLTASICAEFAVALFKTRTEYDFSPLGKLSPDDPFKVHLEYLQTYEKQQVTLYAKL